MTNLNYEVKDQLNDLGIRVANLAIENSRLKAINKAAFRRIDELENPKESVGKKPKTSD